MNDASKEYEAALVARLEEIDRRSAAFAAAHAGKPAPAQTKRARLERLNAGAKRA